MGLKKYFKYIFVILLLVIITIGATQKKNSKVYIPIIDEITKHGCQYIILFDNNHQPISITHKGNCENHKENKK